MWSADRNTLPANITWSAALAASHATNHGYPWHWVRDATRNAMPAKQNVNPNRLHQTGRTY